MDITVQQGVVFAGLVFLGLFGLALLWDRITFSGSTTTRAHR